MAYAAANLDETRFPDPDKLDIDRPQNRHLAFGHGLHRCVGAPLASRELTILVEVMLRATDEIRLVGTPRYGAPTAAGSFLGLDEVILEVTEKS